MASSRPDLLRGFRSSLSAARTGFTWLRDKAGTVLATLVALLAVTLVASGVPLIWQYEPAGTPLLQQLHEGAAYLLIILTLVLALRAPVARLRRRSSHLGWLVAPALLGLTLAAGTSGVAIAWDEIHTPSHAVVGDPGTGGVRTLARPPELVEPGTPVIPPERDSGTAAATQEGVVRIVSDDAPLRPEEYTGMSWLHLAVLPALTAMTYGGGRWLQLRRRREADPEAPKAEPGDAGRDDGTGTAGPAAEVTDSNTASTGRSSDRRSGKGDASTSEDDSRTGQPTP